MSPPDLDGAAGSAPAPATAALAAALAASNAASGPTARAPRRWPWRPKPTRRERRSTRVALGAQVLGLGALLTLLWGLGLPRYLLLDRIALEAATRSGLVGGAAVTLASLAVALARIRFGHRGHLALGLARDLAALSSVVAIAGWLVNRAQASPVPYVESFSLLSMQVASSWALAIGLYVTARSTLRRWPERNRLDGLPGVRAVFTTVVAVLGLFASVALGVGSAGRAAGALDRQRAEHLEHLVVLLAAGVEGAPTDAGLDRALFAFETELNLRAHRTSAGALPPELAAALTDAEQAALARPEPEADGTVVVRVGDARMLWARRTTRHGLVWLSTAANVRPPVRAPDDAPSLLVLALLVLGAPLAALAVAQDLTGELRAVSRDLAALGRGDGRRGPAGVPVASHDEVGDLAVSLNAACGRFAERAVHLSAELDAAEASDRARNRVLAAASHELRTPLTSIVGYCHLLEARGGLNAGQREDVTVIARSAEQLLGHVDEILDLSHIEAGEEAALVPAAVHLGPLAQAVVAEVSATLGEVGTMGEAGGSALDLRVTVQPDTPPAWVDLRRMRQVLENLVGNAVKFTEAGSVEVRVGPGLLEGAPAVRVQVADTGRGIPEDEREAVFGEFHRVERDRAVVGTGLGLTIARRLVQRHGGRIWVESAVGVGSTFHVLLPAAPTSNASPATTSAEGGPPT